MRESLAQQNEESRPHESMNLVVGWIVLVQAFPFGPATEPVQGRQPTVEWPTWRGAAPGGNTAFVDVHRGYQGEGEVLAVDLRRRMGKARQVAEVAGDSVGGLVFASKGLPAVSGLVMLYP